MNILLYAYLIVGIFFIILGIVFLLGKGSNFIAGFNMESQWKRAQYDERALCKFMGKFMFALAGCWIVSVIGILCHRDKLISFGTVLFIIVIIAGLIYMNTGNRFKKKR